MFGIGGGELVLILIVVLLAVGPDQMPKMLKTVGRGIRDVRKATRELQASVGVDELIGADELRDPLGLKKPIPAKPKPHHVREPVPVAPKLGAFSHEVLEREQPSVGVDLAFAYDRAERAVAAAAVESDQSAPPEGTEPSA